MRLGKGQRQAVPDTRTADGVIPSEWLATLVTNGALSVATQHPMNKMTLELTVKKRSAKNRVTTRIEGSEEMGELVGETTDCQDGCLTKRSDTGRVGKVGRGRTGQERVQQGGARKSARGRRGRQDLLVQKTDKRVCLGRERPDIPRM